MLVIFVFYFIHSISCYNPTTEEILAECPCANKSLCATLKIDPRKELYLFTTGQYYHDYDWTHITTVNLFPDLTNYDPQLLCFAHERGVRVVTSAFFSADQLSNNTAKAQWISSLIDVTKQYYFDGINIDFEDAIPKGSNDAQLLTELVQQVQKTFKAQIPNSIVTFDVAWAPSCIDVRCYDYKGLAEATDYLVVMDYDERSQIFGPCIAGANSDYTFLSKGMEEFIALGISPFQLVMALPWYGHDFPCLNPTNETVCPLEHRPWRGWPCTDLGCIEYSYDYILNNMLPKSTTGRRWDPVSKSPWFNYIDSDGKPHQVWYDDPESIKLKVEWIKSNNNYRGVGMFEANYLDYSDKGKSAEMWDSLNYFFQ